LDAALSQYGLQSERDLLARKERLRKQASWTNPSEHGRVRKALVLSRVTLGADVAITSVVLQKAQRLFPAAELVLIAPEKLRELFGANPKLRIHPVSYPAGGTLLQRLGSWLHLTAALHQEVSGLRAPEAVLIDPDSRFLQLGMLPALRDESHYFFFESRRYGEGSDSTISRLTLQWLNETFGDRHPLLPQLWLNSEDLQFGREVVGALRSAQSRPVIAMSFGVGGNPARCWPQEFEQLVLLRLLQEGCTVLLDKGSGEQELARAEELITLAQKAGFAAIAMDAEIGSALLAGGAADCRLATWQGGIGRWAGLIAASDEFVGYDSAGQHIAAALGVPTIDVFAPPAEPVFRHRWTPTGKGMVRVIPQPDRRGVLPTEAASDQVLRAHREITRTRA
jgi:ADP-heptose:LPS heptosyltransferase